MEIHLTHAASNGDVAILQLEGELDGSNYQQVIAAAQGAYDDGARNLLIDMSGISFMGSAGLVALHSIALLMRGEKTPDPEEGWSALHAAGLAGDEGKQQHIKLLSPQPSVERGLDKTGMREFFEIYTDLEAAVASFG